MDDADLGTLAQDKDDRWMLTFTRRLPHAPEKVWRAVTEPEHMAAWFPDKMVGERRAGAPLRFVAETGDGFEGEMVVFDPPSVMELLWGVDRLRIEVKPDGDGTVLTLTDSFEKFFFKVMTDVVLKDGHVSEREVKFLKEHMLADGKIDDGEWKFLEAVNKKAKSKHASWTDMYTALEAKRAKAKK